MQVQLAQSPITTVTRDYSRRDAEKNRPNIGRNRTERRPRTGETQRGSVGQGLGIRADRLEPGSDLGQSKIENLRVSTFGDENVRRLDIALNDSVRMRRVERISQLNGDSEQRVQFHRPYADQVL